MFTLVFTLILAIPLTIAALITGKKIEKSLKMNRSPFSAQQSSKASVLEGEYEDVSK
jgi:cytochrome c biogenesis protein CcdA